MSMKDQKVEGNGVNPENTLVTVEVSPDLPRFNFSRFSWNDRVKLSTLSSRMQSAALKGDMTDEEVFELADSILTCIVRLVVYVPRSWWTDDAPDELDLTQLETYKEYMLGTKMYKLRAALNEALAEEEKK